jgi:tRNA pseudouridine55 synthase
LQKVKWLLRAEKAGHTGTLDPLASGVLPLCFGAATKFSQLQLEADKTYEAIARLGQTTTTAMPRARCCASVVDLAPSRPSAWRRAGAVHRRHPAGAADAQRAEEGRQGLYEYARAGVEVERPARAVTIHALNWRWCRTTAIRPSNESDLQQGHLHPHAGRGHRRGLGCGAHLRAAPHRNRRLDRRAA